MMRRSPLVTLLAVGAGLAVLLVVNMTQASDDPASTGQPGPGSATSSAPAPSGSEAPSGPPSGSASPSGQPTATVTLPPASTATLTPPTVKPGSPSLTNPPSTQPPDSVFPDKILYAGRTVDGQASVAIAVLNGRAAAYFCDGRAVEAWLTGTATGNRIVLRSKSGAAIEARLAAGRLNGTVTVDDRAFRFSVGTAAPPAGLYRAKTTVNGRDTTIGWIVLKDGTQVGVRNTSGERGAAPRLDVGQRAATVDGTRISAIAVNGGTVF